MIDGADGVVEPMVVDARRVAVAPRHVGRDADVVEVALVDDLSGPGLVAAREERAI